MEADLNITEQPNKNPFSQILNVLVSPISAFADLKPKTYAWLPLLLILIMQVAVIVVYFLNVDFSWMMEQSVLATGREIPPEQQQAMERMSGGVMRGITVGFAVIAVIVMWSLFFALLALYYMIVSSFTADGIKYGKWFGFNWWTALPYTLTATIAIISVFLSSNGQILQNDLNPLTLNNLVFHKKIGEPGFGFLGFIDAALVWSLILQVVGYRTWTGKSYGSAIFIVAIPFVLLFSIFALISFR